MKLDRMSRRPQILRMRSGPQTEFSDVLMKEQKEDCRWRAPAYCSEERKRFALRARCKLGQSRVTRGAEPPKWQWSALMALRRIAWWKDMPRNGALCLPKNSGFIMPDIWMYHRIFITRAWRIMMPVVHLTGRALKTCLRDF